MFILLAIGSLAVLSSTAPPGCREGGGFTYFKRHLLSILIGVVLLFIFRSLDYEKLFLLSKPLLFLSFVLLIMVFVVGEARGGAYRWIKIVPGFAFQPAELAKLSIIVYTASFLTRKQAVLNSFRYALLPLLVITLVLCALIMLQPDMGTALVIMGLSVMMWWIGGMNTLRILGVVLLLFLLGVLLIWIEPYRMIRVQAFLNPWADPHGYGYQIIQSLLAFGVGGLWGTGLGKGLQKFYYLPAPYTDFIFAVIGEELGFLGSLIVLSLYVAIAWASFSIAKGAQGMFGKLLGMGITFLFLLQAFINLGGVTNFIPCTGIPLPFVSYGGSSMVINLSFIGILLSIARKGRIDNA